jgi:hypothetical protein
MFHVTFPRIAIRAPAKPWSRASSTAYRHAAVRVRRTESIAAPLTLAVVVVGGLGLAVVSALFTALGG